MAYVVEKHFVSTQHPLFVTLDNLAWASKNLYNQALYRYRQNFIAGNGLLSSQALSTQFVTEHAECYYAMNTKLAQHVIRQVDAAFSNWCGAVATHQKHPEKFKTPPKMPSYKKKDGRNQVTFTIQALSRPSMHRGKLRLAGTNFDFDMRIAPRALEKTGKDGRKYTTLSVKAATVVPRSNGYLVAIQHEVDAVPEVPENGRYAGVDIGLGNLAAVVTNIPGDRPFLINGRPLKSINAYYNKHVAKLRSELDTSKSRHQKKEFLKKIYKITAKRNAKIDDYLHKASRILVNRLVSQDVTHLVIGKNDQWKQEINIGATNNQNFVAVPHARFVAMLVYKFQALGRQAEVHEESYTSKCSFLDHESIEKHSVYAGRRIKRGLFRSAERHLLNADINGAANILRKGVRNAFDHWLQADLIQGFTISPVNLTVPQCKLKSAA